jgi:phosphate-selective porin OprO/OprP
MNPPLSRVLALVVLLSSGFALPRLASQPLERAELEALRARVRELEAQLQAITHRLDLAASPAQSAAPAPAGGSASVERAPVEPRGAAPQSESLRLRTLLHVDARAFTAGVGDDTLVLRRARLAAEGVLLPRARYVLMADFGGGGFNLLDANVAFELGAGLQFRAGKFKSPLGLEILHPAHAVTFTERSVVSALLPNRDVGLQLSAQGADGAIAGAIGVFNGVVDGAHGGNFDTDQQREAIGRVMVAPFRRASAAAWRGFTLGVGGSHGPRHGPAGLPAAYRSPGQEKAFAYRPGVVADGVAWRMSPQFEYRHGPLGLFGEHAVSAVRVRPAATAAALELRHRAWQLTAGYVLTGEDSAGAGVVPRTDFDPAGGAWGAVEVVGRWSRAEWDDAAFPLVATPDGNAAGVTTMAAGLNWHLSRAVRAMFDYYYTRFERPGGATGSRRPAEGHFVSRLQLAF